MVKSIDLPAKAARYLDILCNQLSNRQVGRPGNRLATDFFAEAAGSFGFEIETPGFDCIDWMEDGASLSIGATDFEVQASPYTLGCRVEAPLATASTMDELELGHAGGKILLLYGELAREPLMPKNFTFYNPERHQRIVRVLERMHPAAIVTATARSPELAGGIYPFPMIEDGDFDIPSVYMTEEEGARLALYDRELARLEIKAERFPARGCNVIARPSTGSGGDPSAGSGGGSPTGSGGGPLEGSGSSPSTYPSTSSGGSRRVVFLAHIDAKYGTPGALDNGTGVVTLLLLAELLAGYDGELGVEIMAINGEDYYAASGQMLYLRQNASRLGDIVLAVNLDAAGYIQGRTAFSIYDCPLEISRTIRAAFSTAPGMIEGEHWYQGDHSMFVQNGVPAMAITSERFIELSTFITHTPQDRPELVDTGKLVTIAKTLRTLLLSLNQSI